MKDCRRRPQYVEEIGDAIKKLRQEGQIGILLVEQYLDFCLDVGDSFYIMDRGAIVAEGPISHLNDEIVKQHLTVLILWLRLLKFASEKKAVSRWK
jgi:urea transport system ATP-binding protein